MASSVMESGFYQMEATFRDSLSMISLLGLEHGCLLIRTRLTELMFKILSMTMREKAKLSWNGLLLIDYYHNIIYILSLSYYDYHIIVILLSLSYYHYYYHVIKFIIITIIIKLKLLKLSLYFFINIYIKN